MKRFIRVQEAFNGQQRFAGDASHQLRTPLTALLGQVQVALRRDRSPEEYRRVLELVRTEGDRLRQIVESLLLLAQPEGLHPEPEVLDLRRWVADHVRRWATHPRAGDLRAEVADGVALTVTAHPQLLAQLVDNLLDNAFKYSAPGTPVVSERGARMGRWPWESKTVVAGYPLKICPASSSRSSVASRRGAAVTQASAWAWPWLSALPTRSAEPSMSGASPGWVAFSCSASPWLPAPTSSLMGLRWSRSGGMTWARPCGTRLDKASLLDIVRIHAPWWSA